MAELPYSFKVILQIAGCIPMTQHLADDGERTMPLVWNMGDPVEGIEPHPDGGYVISKEAHDRLMRGGAEQRMALKKDLAQISEHVAQLKLKEEVDFMVRFDDGEGGLHDAEDGEESDAQPLNAYDKLLSILYGGEAGLPIYGKFTFILEGLDCATRLTPENTMIWQGEKKVQVAYMLDDEEIVVPQEFDPRFEIGKGCMSAQWTVHIQLQYGWPFGLGGLFPTGPNKNKDRIMGFDNFPVSQHEIEDAVVKDCESMSEEYMATLYSYINAMGMDLLKARKIIERNRDKNP